MKLLFIFLDVIFPRLQLTAFEITVPDADKLLNSKKQFLLVLISKIIVPWHHALRNT